MTSLTRLAMFGRSRRGFTLIEMLIVVVIVAILAAIAYGRFNRPSLSTVVVPDSVVAPLASGRFVVQVENAFGRPQRGVPVVFRVLDGAGTISPEVVETDSTGTAAAQWIAGTVAGVNAFAATVGQSEWDRTQATVTVRVDPALAPPAASTPAADTAAPGGAGGAADTTAPRSTPPRDTGRAAPPPDGGDGASGRAPDSAMMRVPWTSAPLWASMLLEPVGTIAVD